MAELFCGNINFFFHAFVTNGIERDKIHRILLKLIYRKYSMKNTEYFRKLKKSVVFNLLQNESQRTYPGYALSANPRLKISFLLKTKPWIETRQPWGNEHQDISYTLLCASYYLLWADSLSETTEILFFNLVIKWKREVFLLCI